MEQDLPWTVMRMYVSFLASPAYSKTTVIPATCMLEAMTVSCDEKLLTMTSMHRCAGDAVLLLQQLLSAIYETVCIMSSLFIDRRGI